MPWAVRPHADGFGAYVHSGDRAVRIQPLGTEDRCAIGYRLREHVMRRVVRAVLAEIIGSAVTWLGGATPGELARTWPFAGFIDVAAAFERGDRIELGWQHVRLRDWGGHGEFVEAAMRAPGCAGCSRSPRAPTIDPAHVQPTYRPKEQRRKLTSGDRSATCYPDRREFGYAVEFRWRDEHIAYAWAPEPAAASGAAEAWVGGASPRKLAEAWPFANFVAPGEAFERGDLLEYEWLQARAHAHYGLRPLIEAAMHEPHLRQLYPMVLANMLRFRPARDGAPPGPNIEFIGDGRYQVLDNHWNLLGKGNVEDTIRTCVAELSRAEPPPP